MKAVSDEYLNLLECHTVSLCKQFGHFEGSWCHLQSHTVQEGMSGTICLLTQHDIPDDLNLQYNHCENFNCPTVFSGS